MPSFNKDKRPNFSGQKRTMKLSGVYQDWDEQCCRPLLFSYRNSIPGSTGGQVAGALAAYENQVLRSPLFSHNRQAQ